MVSSWMEQESGGGILSVFRDLFTARRGGSEGMKYTAYQQELIRAQARGSLEAPQESA
jgi:hypothetical protein